MPDVDRDSLRRLLASGLSYEEIGRRFGRHPSTVSDWARGKAVVELVCRHHGRTGFYIEGRGSHRCMRCRLEAVARRRRTVKAILLEEAGGRCRVCGYSRCADALHFHHLDPASKSFAIGSRGLTRSLDALRARPQNALCCAQIATPRSRPVS